MRSRINNRLGFTLVEVLLALAILLMSTIMLAGGYLNVLNGYAAMAGVTARDADLKFAASALLAEPDRDAVEKGGDFEGSEGRHVRWKAKVDPTETADVFTVTFDCEINSPQMRQPESVHQAIVLLRPTWSKNGEGDKLRALARDRIIKMQSIAP